MKLLIPMAGYGERFRKAGYTAPKPLIEVDGKPMIAWVLEMFPGATDITFICNEAHLATTPMRQHLQALAPGCDIIGIEGHKLGPVTTILAALDAVPDKEDVLVSYCDYTMHWDYPHFLKRYASGQYDGVVVCYRGFHPHLTHPQNIYAGCRMDDTNTMLEIREKHNFAPTLIEGIHSTGTYYFREGALIKKYFRQLVDSGATVWGEYFVSQVYQLMLDDGLRVGIDPDVKHFCQWGTPEDLREYEYWSGCIKEWKK